MKYSIYPRCQYCLRKMPSKYILCIPCNLELCLKCFCYGVEGGNHRKTHRYKVEDGAEKTQDNIFKIDSNWSYDEELKLLNGAGVYKSGNWHDIAAMVQTKTAEECRKHFIDNFIEGELGRQIIHDIATSKNGSTANIVSVYDHTSGISSPLFYERYPPSLMNVDEDKCLGYLPRRNEFMKEYDDGAEKLICAIEPDCNVGSLVSAINVNLIDIYNLRVSRRCYWKHVALEHGLMHHLIAQILDKCPRDYNYFNRQLLKRAQPSSCLSVNRQRQSIFGRSYVHRQRSLFLEPSLDCSTTYTPSTASDNDFVPATPSSSISQPLFPTDSTEPSSIEEQPFWHYNPSLIDGRLKPFLRYLSSHETKKFLESIKTEDVLKKEIDTLQLCVSHGITSYQDYKSKLDSLNKHKDTTPNIHRKVTKRKRGRQRCFQYTYMMRKKRLEKYMESLKNDGITRK